MSEVNRQFGLLGECRALSKLRTLDPSIVKLEPRYEIVDFIGNNADIELKTRRVCYGYYPDVMIGVNKITKYNPAKKLYFAFQFTNGIWYIEYTPEAFEDIPVRYFKNSKCFFIKLDRLEPILHDTDA
jgi:hypothetical protein